MRQLVQAEAGVGPLRVLRAEWTGNRLPTSSPDVTWTKAELVNGAESATEGEPVKRAVTLAPPDLHWLFGTAAL
ncbi:hypothetical protein [Streptomyces sp. NBC_00663]|uniref:hypothetical protein n=1 Tax=Streptomyces sp. NBC_00663 TaxID=2975801 RepID=UPI002E2FFCA0|nr:hypothetical protein [Streptomyces sp. NBC_00663]